MNNIFKGINAEDKKHMMSCMKAETVTFKKGDYIIHYHDIVKYIYIIDSGVAEVVNYDFFGNEFIIQRLIKEDVIGLVKAYNEKTAQVDIICKEDITALRIDVYYITRTCSNACSYHKRLIDNIIATMALKSDSFQDKIFYLSQKSSHDKILAYLYNQKRKNNSDSFDIPFNRQQLADYLNIDRSALSRELSKLKVDKIIDFHKNHFEVY